MLFLFSSACIPPILTDKHTSLQTHSARYTLRLKKYRNITRFSACIHENVESYNFAAMLPTHGYLVCEPACLPAYLHVCLPVCLSQLSNRLLLPLEIMLSSTRGLSVSLSLSVCSPAVFAGLACRKLGEIDDRTGRSLRQAIERVLC